jgi:hypothetical protein
VEFLNRVKFSDIMKRFYYTLIGLIFVGALNINAKPGGDYETERNADGDFEQTDVWKKGNAPSADGIVDKRMTINGSITRNGELNPVDVVVNGTFIVTENYYNNNWSGLTVTKDGYVEIFGNLEGSAGIQVDKGGILIVHGNLSSTGSNLKSNGDIIVKGDFSTSSNTHVQNKGNLIVGGDFSHSGGGLKAKPDDLYIINPDAEISYPEGSILENDNSYGDMDDLLNSGEDADLKDLIESIGMLNPVISWIGSENTDWSNPDNWKGNKLPKFDSSVKIEISGNVPQINSDITLSNLTIVEGAKLVINPGASLEVIEDVSNNGQFVLESEADQLASLMLPENATKVGEANVKLKVPENNYWYLSTPLANARADWFGSLNNDTKAKDWVFVLRESNGKNKWLRVVGDIALNPLEGVSTWYYDEEKQLDYTGELNAGDISATYGQPDYYLLGNPYATSIDWDVLEEENRDGTEFSQTMWFRVTRKGFDGKTYRTWQTYNTFFSAIDPEVLGYSKENESFIAPYQTVWIKAEKSNATFTVSENSKVKAKGSLPLKNASSQNHSEMNVLRIKAANDKIDDGTVIFFNNNGASGYDSFDGDKRFNDSKAFPELYTRVDDKPLAINSLPSLSASNYSIPFSVRNRTEGEVKLSIDLEEFTNNYEVVLEDRETGSYTNMGDVAVYSYTPRQMGDDHDRFVLHLSKVQSVATSIEEETQTDEQISILGQKEDVLVRISSELLRIEPATIEVLDMSGRMLNTVNTRSSETEVSLPAVHGVYMVRVIARGTIKTEKVAR